MLSSPSADPSPAPRRSVCPVPVCLALAAVALGHAIQIADGFYNPEALRWLTAAIALTIVGVVVLRERLKSSGDEVLTVVIAAGIAWQLWELLTSRPAAYLSPGTRMGLFRGAVVAEALVIGLGVLLGLRRGGAPAPPGPITDHRGHWTVAAGRAWFPTLLMVHAFAGAWVIHASPSPRIDTVVVHRAAIRALVHGRDPYRITYENIYGAGTGFYNPQVLVGGRVAFGYPYPPLSLLLVAPGQTLAGDYRYAELAALIGGVALIGCLRSSISARLAASLLLTTPRGLFVIEQGWSEPAAVLALGATVFCLARKPRWAPWAAGLLIAVKQYLVIAALPLLRYAWRARRDRTGAFVLRATAAGLGVTLPFALWHPRAFFDSVIRLQTLEPFRTDSLSYLSWAARAGWGTGSLTWSLAAGLAAVTAAMVRTPNTAAGFARSLSLALLIMFAFGTKAFCNYYFFVIAAMCCAVAAPAACSPDLRRDDALLQPAPRPVVESPDPAPGTAFTGSTVRYTPGKAFRAGGRQP